MSQKKLLPGCCWSHSAPAQAPVAAPQATRNFNKRRVPVQSLFWDTLTYIAGFGQLSPLLSPITNTGTCKLASLTAAFADEDRFYIIGKVPLQLPLWDTSINIWSQPSLRSHQRCEKLSLLITSWSGRDNFASALHVFWSSFMKKKRHLISFSF